MLAIEDLCPEHTAALSFAGGACSVARGKSGRVAALFIRSTCAWKVCTGSFVPGAHVSYDIVAVRSGAQFVCVVCRAGVAAEATGDGSVCKVWSWKGLLYADGCSSVS